MKKLIEKAFGNGIAQYLSVSIVDDCATQCKVYYGILDANGQALKISDCEIIITGDEYHNWNGSNDYIYNKIAVKEGLTIISDFVV